MSEKLTILCIPLNSIGHINPCIGLCIEIKKKGHRIVFALEDAYKGKVASYGFEEIFYDLTKSSDQFGSKRPFLYDIAKDKSQSFIQNSWLNEMKRKCGFFSKVAQSFKYSSNRIQEIINFVKPDLIIEDNVVSNPILARCKIPLIYLFSFNPLRVISNENLPPSGTGLPLNDRADWVERKKKISEIFSPLWEDLNEWAIENQAPPLPLNRLEYTSTNLNIVLCPKPIFKIYAERVSLGDEWMVVNHLMRDKPKKFTIPEKLQKRGGKLILFSMGTVGSTEVNIMKRYIKILAKSKHRFIVSKGPNHEQFELAENMWGEASIPQLDILPLVDLVIFHGGNNTFTETVYFGKPMIVMPLFGDQPDNAQLIVEAKIGLRLDPFTVTENELLSAIDTLIEDKEIHERIKKISEEVRFNSNLDNVIKRIEDIARKPKLPTVFE